MKSNYQLGNTALKWNLCMNYISLFQEEELYKISIDSDDIENSYGHYFDLVLTISDMETTLNQLYHAVCKMATEPSWVPVR